MSAARTIWLAVLALMVCALPAWALDPAIRLSQYAHTAWKVRDGGLRGTPYAMTQTVDGFVWIGTANGLFRFDGIRFTRWLPPDDQRLPSAVILGLLGAKDGSLWIGTRSGLSHWHDQQLTNYPTVKGGISSILEDRSGRIWVTRAVIVETSGPLCQVTPTVRCYGPVDGLRIINAGALTEDIDGALWIGGDTAFVRWQAGVFEEHAPEALRANVGQDPIAGLVTTADGTRWVGIPRAGPGLGLQTVVKGELHTFTAGWDGSSAATRAVYTDRSDTVWVGTQEDGIYRIRGKNVERFRKEDGLSGHSAFGFYEDRENNIWVLTEEGVDCFRDVKIVSFSVAEGLGTTEVDSVMASRDGTLWVGGNGALNTIRGNVVSSIETGKSAQITAMFEDAANRLWIGIDNTISIYHDGRFHPVTKRDGAPVGLVSSIAEDAEHNIWLNIAKPKRALLRIRDREVVEEVYVPQIPAVRALAADPESGIWFGLFDGGLARYRHGQLERIAFDDISATEVDQVVVRRDGSVLGATNTGLIGWRKGRPQTLTTRNGLPCNGVYALVFDAQDALWLSTPCGFVYIANGELERWWTHADTRVQHRLFDVYDGAQPGASPFQPAARTSDGRLWFANNVQLQMIDPSRVAGNLMPPPVQVEELVAGGRKYSSRGDLQLPALIRELEIDYTALSFVAPQKVRFRYVLEGRDTDWQDVGTRRQAFYSDLRPGTYRFRVTASNSDNAWSQQGASMTFTVAAAWYQTRLFVFWCVASALLAVSLLYRLRVRQIARAFRLQFDQRLSERTRIARDLHDTFLQTIQGSRIVADDALERRDDLLGPVQARLRFGE